jgi:DNA mismatch repair ATPase MutS
LQQILARFDVRLNMLAFFILNTFCLWDLWQIIALNEWKKANKPSVANWFNTIAQLEIAGSFGTLSFNNDDWCFPEIANEHFTLSGNAIGHPLILKQQSVTNHFSISGTARIDLITGSNMAGKSTFLRSLGVNIILAYAGSCVCAKTFTVSVAELMSSMRIEDNLAENTSTFYAELKKIKSIIDAVNEERKLFILLDEILRGTNSLDRHTGSKALIQQLIKHNAVGIIATHDIELSKLENDFPSSIKNYHFDVQVDCEKLFFDYKLKQGICSSMNASILMKQIGIEM